MKHPTRISTDDYETARLLAEREHRRAMGLSPLRWNIHFSPGAWRALFIGGPLLILAWIIAAVLLQMQMQGTP